MLDMYEMLGIIEIVKVKTWKIVEIKQSKCMTKNRLFLGFTRRIASVKLVIDRDILKREKFLSFFCLGQCCF